MELNKTIRCCPWNSDQNCVQNSARGVGIKGGLGVGILGWLGGGSRGLGSRAMDASHTVLGVLLEFGVLFDRLLPKHWRLHV